MAIQETTTPHPTAPSDVDATPNTARAPAPAITWDTHFSQGGPAALGVLAEVGIAIHFLSISASKLLRTVLLAEGSEESDLALRTLGTIVRRQQELGDMVTCYAAGPGYDDLTLGEAFDAAHMGPAYAPYPELTPDGQLLKGVLYV